MKVHVDADSLVYACGFAADTEPVENCLHLLNISLQKIVDDLQPSSFQVFLTGSSNFRDAVTSDYKANRVNMRKPVHYHAAREHLYTHWNAVIVEGMEADDAVALAQTADSILVSQDKDLRMVPGWHYNYRKPEQGVFLITEEEAQRWFYYQMLAGDRVDNIKGLPYCTEEIVEKYNLSQRALKGCGEKTAELLLSHGDNEQEWYEITKECYESFDNTLETFNINAQLLWMVQELDQDGNIVPWRAPCP